MSLSPFIDIAMLIALTIFLLAIPVYDICFALMNKGKVVETFSTIRAKRFIEPDEVVLLQGIKSYRYLFIYMLICIIFILIMTAAIISHNKNIIESSIPYLLLQLAGIFTFAHGYYATTIILTDKRIIFSGFFSFYKIHCVTYSDVKRCFSSRRKFYTMLGIKMKNKHYYHSIGLLQNPEELKRLIHKKAGISPSAFENFIDKLPPLGF